MLWNARLYEAQGGVKTSGRDIHNLKYTDTPHLWQKVKKTKEHLDESEKKGVKKLA